MKGSLLNWTFILICVCFNLNQTLGQTAEGFNVNKIIPPSPTATSFLRYGDFKGASYTGQPVINIPLYEVKSGDISVPVGLTYNLASVKPNEIPGWVGLGWDIGCGGVITRTIRGLPDDLNDGRVGYYFDRENFNTNFNQVSASDTYAVALMSGTVDSEPDIFNFNFAGHSGSFVIGHDGTVKLSSKEKLQVLFSPSTPWSFQIITEDGTAYEFGAGEQTQYDKNGLIWLYSSWFLTSISSNGNTVNFQYTGENFTNKITRVSNFKTYNYCSATQNLGSQYDVSSSLPIYLSEIHFNFGKLKFNLDNWDGSVRRLNSISLYDKQDNLLRTWQFTYSTSARVKLASVQEVGGPVVLPPYEFIYNLQGFNYSAIGAVGAVDHWGYYNGALGAIEDFPLLFSSGVPLGEVNRESDENFIKAQTLEKIVFPTGGYTEFEYELHDFGNYSSVRLGNSRTDLQHGYNGQCLPGNDVCYEQSFSFDASTSITLTKTTALELTIYCADCDAVYSSSYAHNSDKWWTFRSPGTYTINSLFNDPINGIKATPEYYIDTRDVRFSLTAYDFVQSNRGGGLRVKKITSSDGQGNEVVKSYEYESDGVSTGILSEFPVYEKFIEYEAMFSTCRVLSSRPLNKKPAGPDVTYRMVREVLADGSYTESHFSTLADYPDGYAGVGYGDNSNNNTTILIPDNDIERVDNSNMRGQLREQAYFDASHNILKSINYNYTESDIEYTGAIRVENLARIDNPYPGGNDPTIGLGSKIVIKSSWVKKESETETSYTYIGGNQYSAVTQTSYFYENPEHLQLTRLERTTSKGEKLIEKTFYPADYSVANGGTRIAELKAAHVHGVPIQKNSLIEKAGIQYVTSSQIFKYGTNLLPQEVVTLQNDHPLTPAEFPAYVPSSGFNTSLYKSQGEYTYNAANRIVQFQKNGDFSSLVWGYNSELPIAQVTNAQQNQIFHTSFEDDATAITNDAITGSRSKNGFSVTLNNLTAGVYILSHWKKVNGVWEFQTPQEVTVSTSHSISLTGQVDEVRFYPKAALMTTYTYNKLRGITTATDANNLTTFYEYDALGRLKLISDHDRKALKTFDYYYKGGQ